MDESRRPVAGATVYVVAAPQSLPDVALLTDASGRFALTAPVPGKYVIAARSSMLEVKQVEVYVTHEAAPDVQIVLTRHR
jgi:hypothetical protein